MYRGRNLKQWKQVLVGVTKLIPFLNQRRHEQTDVFLTYITIKCSDIVIYVLVQITTYKTSRKKTENIRLQVDQV